MRITLTVLAVSISVTSGCNDSQQDPLVAAFRADFPGDACKQLKVEVGDWEKLRETPQGARSTHGYWSNPSSSSRIAIIYGPYTGPVCDREGLCRGQEQIEIAAFFAGPSLYGDVYQVRGKEVGSEPTLKAGCAKPGPPPDIVAEGRKKLEAVVATGIAPWSEASQRSVGIALQKPEDLIGAPPTECPELRALKPQPSDDEFERKRKEGGQAAAAKSCQAKLSSNINVRGTYRLPIEFGVDTYNFEKGELMLKSLDSSPGYSVQRDNSVYVGAPGAPDLQLNFPPEYVPVEVPEAEAKALKLRLSGARLSLDLVFSITGEISTGLRPGAMEADVLGYRVVDERGTAVTPWIAAAKLSRP